MGECRAAVPWLDLGTKDGFHFAIVFPAGTEQRLEDSVYGQG